MTDRKPIHAPALQTTRPDTTIEVWVSYDDGKGPGYHDGLKHVRGYTLHAQPIVTEQTDTPGVVVKTFMGYTGIKGVIEETPGKKYNANRHAEFAQEAPSTDLYRRLIEYVVKHNGITLKS
jgi:hypothetical protein